MITSRIDRYLAFVQNTIGLIPGMGWRTAKHSDLPTCVEALRRVEYGVEGGAGVADRHVRCMKSATDTYAWEEHGLAALDARYVNTGGDTLTGVLTNADGLALSNAGLDARYVNTGTDPNADRIYFWDDSAGSEAYLAPGQGLQISGTTLLSHLAPGIVTAYAGSTAPTGWLLCDGGAVSRTTYAALFAVIGTTYGAGDGATTFNVPNLQGRVPVGLDLAQTEFNALGETGGAKTHTLTIAEMPAHAHTGDTYTQPFYTGTDGTGGASRVYTHSFPTQGVDSAGGGGAHNNLPPYLTLHFVIKT